MAKKKQAKKRRSKTPDSVYRFRGFDPVQLENFQRFTKMPEDRLWVFYKAGYRYTIAAKHSTQSPKPPVNAQLALDLFLPAEVCENFLGDLEERYHTKLARLGKARADIWYRKQVLTSLWPIACGAWRRISQSTVKRVFSFALRLVGFPGLADTLSKAADNPPKKQIGQ